MDSPDIQIPGYRIHTAIGHGGMASVYLATQESLNRKVAIKVLRHGNEPGIGERFINEARYIASLNSPHIITIYDIAALEGGDSYIAMEFVAGGDLAENAARLSSVHSALQVIRQVALALQVVHDSGIIHRDVKPTNILFRRDGTAVLTDFGIAKEIENPSDLTLAGFSLGSPSYSSPEQAQCFPIDLTTDIYSLGVVLLELLLGYNPFKGDSHTNTALNHIQLPLPELPSKIRHLSPLLEKMLAKDPGERYQSIGDLIIEIDRALTMADATAAPGSALQPVARFFGQLRWPAFALPARLAARLPALLPTRAGLLRFRERVGRSLRGVPPIPRRGRQSLAAIACTVMMAIIYFATFSPSETEREIERLLQRAEQSMHAGRFMAPENDNAHDLYGQVLQLDHTNLKAIWGVKTAEQKQVEAYLAQADQALEQRRLQRPEGSNALHYYRQALAIHPENSRARTGIRQVIQEYIRLARDEMSESNYSQATDYVDGGLSIAPNNALLLSLRDEINKRREQLLAQQRQPPPRRVTRVREKPPTVRTYIRSALDKLRDKIDGD
ncbi:protein kinase domain-containing protein [Microbulbifer guangxiensis]|uniref:protein kinase domain-containing protein n=1 Tax=Microbulbifer guangxiensis TaxID=2904249 RepID=UPI001F03133D|nr:protein kinase [Microbulbifer guangxiensis]